MTMAMGTAGGSTPACASVATCEGHCLSVALPLLSSCKTVPYLTAPPQGTDFLLRFHCCHPAIQCLTSRPSSRCCCCWPPRAAGRSAPSSSAAHRTWPPGRAPVAAVEIWLAGRRLRRRRRPSLQVKKREALPLLALSLPLCQRLMPLLVVPPSLQPSYSQPSPGRGAQVRQLRHRLSTALPLPFLAKTVHYLADRLQGPGSSGPDKPVPRNCHESADTHVPSLSKASC